MQRTGVGVVLFCSALSASGQGFDVSEQRTVEWIDAQAAADPGIGDMLPIAVKRAAILIYRLSGNVV